MRGWLLIMGWPDHQGGRLLLHRVWQVHRGQLLLIGGWPNQQGVGSFSTLVGKYIGVNSSSSRVGPIARRAISFSTGAGRYTG